MTFGTFWRNMNAICASLNFERLVAPPKADLRGSGVTAFRFRPVLASNG